MNHHLLDMPAAADYLGITPNTLRAYRFKRYPADHPTAPFPQPSLRAGGRSPMWTREKLDAWTARRESNRADRVTR